MLTRRQLLAQAAALPYVDKRGAEVRPGPAADAFRPAGEDVPIGFFGPADPAHPLGGSVYMGAQMAVDDANASLVAGKPFRLVSRWADDPWRAGASAVVRLVYTDGVLAVVGGIDGATTHLAAQVSAKALVPVLDPVSTDDSTNQAGVPWVFSWAPGDTQIAAALAERIGRRSYSVLASTHHDSRHLANTLLKTGVASPLSRIDFARPDPELAQTVLVPSPEAVVLLAPPAETAALAPRLQGAALLAGPSAHSRLCHSLRLESVPLCPEDASLLRRMERRFGATADVFSLLAYSSVQLLLRVSANAGTSRASLREALAAQFLPNGRRAAQKRVFQEVSSK